jgi:hypothetical protein
MATETLHSRIQALQDLLLTLEGKGLYHGLLNIPPSEMVSW